MILFIIKLPKLSSLKCLKCLIVFSADGSKKNHDLANAYEKSYWVLSRMACFGVAVKPARKYWNSAFSRADILLITIRIYQSIEFSERTR